MTVCDRLGEDDFEDVSTMLMPAIYALLHKGIIVYIGQSKKPLTRIYTHRNLWGRRNQTKGWRVSPSTKGMLFDQIWVRPCRVEELNQLEGDMILKYKPRYNVNAGKYTTIPLEAQNIVERIVAQRATQNNVPIVTTHAPIVRVDRRGF